MQALAGQKVLETGVAVAVFATVFLAGGRFYPLRGVIKDQIGLRIPLSKAAEAHIALESRATSGAIVLLP